MKLQICANTLILHYSALELMAELKKMTSEEVIISLQEIHNTYKTLMPLMDEKEHRERIKHAWETAEDLASIMQEKDTDEWALSEKKLDLFNAVSNTNAAIATLKERYPDYANRYPDTRPFVEDNAVLEVPVVVEHHAPSRKPEEILTIANGPWINFMRPEDIMYLEAQSNYTKIFNANGEITITSKTLAEHNENLPSQFVRINRSVIVNSLFVDKISRAKDLLVLKNQLQFKVTQNADLLIGNKS